LGAARDTVIELRRQAGYVELQSAMKIDLNSYIRLKKEAKVLRDVANEIEKENSYSKMTRWYCSFYSNTGKMWHGKSKRKVRGEIQQQKK
jgi:hypothetical protein